MRKRILLKHTLPGGDRAMQDVERQFADSNCRFFGRDPAAKSGTRSCETPRSSPHC